MSEREPAPIETVSRKGYSTYLALVRANLSNQKLRTPCSTSFAAEVVGQGDCPRKLVDRHDTKVTSDCMVSTIHESSLSAEEEASGKLRYEIWIKHSQQTLALPIVTFHTSNRALAEEIHNVFAQKLNETCKPEEAFQWLCQDTTYSENKQVSFSFHPENVRQFCVDAGKTTLQPDYIGTSKPTPLTITGYIHAALAILQQKGKQPSQEVS